MFFSKRILLGIGLMITLSLIGVENTSGWWWTPKAKRKPATHRSRPKPVVAKPKKRPALLKKRTALKAKKYNYIGSHDLNGDGAVDRRDRLLWLERNRKTMSTTLISKENEDLLEDMDLNGDGYVDNEEITIYYNDYDLNNDGKLDSAEINSSLSE